MKKFLFFFLLLMGTFVSQAYDFSAVAPTGQTLYYNISGSTATVTCPGSIEYSPYSGYTKPTGALSIPETVTYNGTTYSVTSIGDYAFRDCWNLTCVTIPNSVTSIGGSAFRDCWNLTCVTIPNSVTSIGGSAFHDCSGLTCVTIPNSVTSIGWSAFRGCSGLTSVTIPNSVTSIGSYAFEYCSGLTSVTIPNSVTSIGSYAFSDCSGLTSVTIGNSVASIGGYAFDYCSNVDTLYYNARNLTTNSSWYESSSSCNSYGFRPMANLNVLVIGDNVQTIPAGAFYSQSHLTSVTIPDSVTSIGGSAFRGCSGLTSVTIPNSVTSIGDYAFRGCSGLSDVFCENNVAPTLGYYVFLSTNLQAIHVPCSGYESYMSHWSWSSYSELIAMPNSSFNRVIEVSDTVRGSVSLLSLSCQDTTIMQAISNYGYHFTQWNDGDTNNPRTFVLTQDTVFTAEFGYNQYTINGLSGNSTLGTVTGVGEYLYLDTVVLTATAVDHYHFAHWQDGNTENPRAVVVMGDADYTAIFEIDVYHIAVESSDLNMGYVSGGGDVTYGQPVTVEATAYSGYHFSCWSNGSRYNPYTFASIQDLTLQAIFVSDEAPYYTITVAANNAAMGSATGSGTYDAGTVALITAVPSEGCAFLHWNDGSTVAERLVEINATATYTAFFAPEQCNVNTTTNIAAAGTVSGNGTYNMGDTVTLTATANDGYRFDHWNDGSTEEVRTVVIDENLSAEMQLDVGNTYGITFTAYFVDEHEGIDDASLDEVRVYVAEGAVVVSGAENERVRVYDLSGRVVAEGRSEGMFRYEAPCSGVYFVRAGIRKAQKVVVVK